jgi:peptidoglycan hydrolase-like protein with peptidoglycan-binding domain
MARLRGGTGDTLTSGRHRPSNRRLIRRLIIGAVGLASAGMIAIGTLPASAATVSQTQAGLAGMGYLAKSSIDGINGPKTRSAVMEFQADRCIAVDGIAGPVTSREIVEQVKRIQAKVSVPRDGTFGPKTNSVVMKWQSDHDLIIDGQAGPDTMQAMGIARKRDCKPTADPKPVGNPKPGGNPKPAGDLRKRIVSIAEAELRNSARNHESGGYNCNFYSTALGVGSRGCSNGWRTDAWCSDFGKWVWDKAGASTKYLNPEAGSFYTSGVRHGTWNGGSSPAGVQVGDAILFNLNRSTANATHVGIVVDVNGDGTISVISGNSGARSSHVSKRTFRPNSTVSGYTGPVSG